MKNRWKKILSAGLISVMALGLVGCGGDKQEAPKAETATEPLTIGLLRIDDSLPFYVAEEAGLFAKHDVEVELVSFSSGRDQSTALDAGELDGMMTDPVVTGLSLKGGTDVRMVAMAFGAVAEEGRFLVVSAPNSGITEPQDLLGKTVAISSNTMMDYLVYRYEGLLGLDAAQIEKVSMPDLMMRTTTLLEGKNIDAAILPDPLAAYAVAEGANVVIDDTKLGQNISQSVVIMTKASIDNRTGDVEKMLAAYNEAIELINNEPENWKTFAMEKANVPAAIAEEYRTPSFTAGVVPSEEDLAPVWDWFVTKGLIEQPYSYEEVVDTRFCE